jgi:hypothetical protein
MEVFYVCRGCKLKFSESKYEMGRSCCVDRNCSSFGTGLKKLYKCPICEININQPEFHNCASN